MCCEETLLQTDLEIYKRLRNSPLKPSFHMLPPATYVLSLLSLLSSTPITEAYLSSLLHDKSLLISLTT